jgi:hypothetical protein
MGFMELNKMMMMMMMMMNAQQPLSLKVITMMLQAAK